MAAGLGAERHVGDVDVAASGDQHGADDANGSVQQHVVCGGNGELVVEGKRAGFVVAHHTGNIYIFASDDDVGAGFEPARAGQDTDRAGA